MGITKEERLRRDKLAEQGIKVCSKCKEEKPFSEFNKSKHRKDGMHCECRKCTNRYKRENKERLKDKNKKYRENNKERINQYRQDNKELISKYNEQYRQDNKDYFKEYYKQRYQKNREQILEYRKQYYQNKKEQIREYNKKYKKKTDVRTRHNRSRKERRQSDPMYRMLQNLSSSFKWGFKKKGWAKDSNTQEVIGCAWEQLALWLCGEPSKEMHIDHVIPQSLAETPDELKLLNHYSNLQLLSAGENLSKNNRYIRKSNLDRVLAHHPEPDKLKEILERSNIEII